MDAEVFPLFSTPVLATRIEVDRDIVRDVHYTPYANDNAGYGSANKKILLEDFRIKVSQKIFQKLKLI